MDFPNIWLTITSVVVTFIVGGIAANLATRFGGIGGQHTVSYTMQLVVYSLFINALLFFALTGAFPWRYVLLGLPLALFSGLTVMAIFLAAGLFTANRAHEVGLLGALFYRQSYGWMVWGYIFVTLLLQIVMVVIAYNKASVTDITTREGLFEVGLWTLSIPTALIFVVSNITRGVSLLSKETSRQIRIHSLVFAFVQYVMAGWAVAYPFYAFRQEETSREPALMLMGAGIYLAMFLFFVIAPYFIGRARFEIKKTRDLTILRNECARLSIATDTTVSPAFAAETLDRSFRNVQRLVSADTYDRPSFANFRERFDALMAKQTEGQEADTAQRVAAEGGQDISDLDHRLFVIGSAERLAKNKQDFPTLRGVASETSLECGRWMSVREGRSGLLALAGVVVSAVIPMLAQLYESEIKSIFNPLLSLVGVT